MSSFNQEDVHENFVADVENQAHHERDFAADECGQADTTGEHAQAEDERHGEDVDGDDKQTNSVHFSNVVNAQVSDADAFGLLAGSSL